MKAFSLFVPVAARVMWLSCFLMVACRDNPRTSDMPEPKADPTAAEQEVPSPEEIKALEREIETGRQNISDIEAFVLMERDKLEENPDYDQSFMLEALNEQEGIREAIEPKEKRLRELSEPKE